MPDEQPEVIKPRNEGCEAVPEIHGTDFTLPVCMGGTALAGCNNPDSCKELFGDRLRDPSTYHVIIRTQDGSRITRVLSVPRAQVKN